MTFLHLLLVTIAGSQIRAEDPFIQKGRRPESNCLTGNSKGESAIRNLKIEGRYTYYDGRTDSHWFPHLSYHQPRDRKANYDESLLSGGWVDFADGKLTDGDMETRVGYPKYLQGCRGIDFVFDLGGEYLIDEIETHAVTNHVRNISVYLRSPVENRWVMVSAISDRARFAERFYPKLSSAQRVPVSGSARWVRVNACFEAHWGGFREIQIWGRPLAKETAPPKKAPVRQAGGRVVVADPAERLLEYSARAILPIPQEVKLGTGSMSISNKTKIVVMSGASERTRRTASVLASDLRDEVGLNLEVIDWKAGEQSMPSGRIVIDLVPEPSLSADTTSKMKGIGPQGYWLKVSERGARMIGRDEQGAFYATQTLMQLLDRKQDGWSIPVCTIRDWPKLTWRSFDAVKRPDRNLLKALARFKITHYLPQGGYLKDAIASRITAENRFIQIVPTIPFNTSWGDNPKEFIERAAEEPLEKLNPGRRNACPSHPDLWQGYLRRLDLADRVYGEFVNIHMDEMYQAHNGSRWNVCPRCRARKMSGHELMADTIARIHNHLKKHDKKTLLIDSALYNLGLSHPDDKANDWRKAANILAEKGLAGEITVYVWHGEKVADRLRSLGFKTIFWATNVVTQSLPNVYSGYYLSQGDSPFRAPYILSMLQGTWSPKHVYPGSAECTSLVEQCMADFNRLWKGRSLPSRRHDAKFFPIDLTKVTNHTFRDDEPFDGKGWADLGPNYDLRALKAGRRVLAGVPFTILDDTVTPNGGCVMVHNRKFFNRSLPDRVEIPVGQKAASIVFAHTLDARPSQMYFIKRELVGYYHMIYEDGSYEPLELKYAINICNFDGLTTWFDYAPRGDSMERASIAWRGQMGAGRDAVIYKTEWVNPKPEKTIRTILFASPWKPVGVNPILLAATAVAPAPDDSALRPEPSPYSDVRQYKNLKVIEPTGRPINLRNGKAESENIWKTAEGITIRSDPAPTNRKVMETSQEYHSQMACLFYDNIEGIRKGAHLTIRFPKPRSLTGIRFIGNYRPETYQVDHKATPLNYEVQVAGKNTALRPIANLPFYIPEEQGPQWIPLGGRSILQIRISTTNKGKETKQGIAFLQIFETDPSSTRSE